MSLHFAPPVAPTVGLLALAVAAAAVVVGVRRLLALGVGRAARPMIALRVAAVTLLLLAFANPTVVSAVPAERRPRVRLLVDDSASMAVPDGRRGTRSDDAKAVVREVRERLDGVFAVEATTFASAAATAGTADTLTAAGEGTDLGAALARAGADAAEPPVAIVLASDGIDTVAPTTPRLPCPVLAVPLGTDLDLVDDARVVALRAPERADLHTTVAVEVEVAVTGSVAFRERHRAPSVSLSRGGEALGAKTVALDGRGRGVARFDVRLDAAGAHVLEARVGPVARDRVAADDRRRAFVLAEDPSLRVLLLAARVTREYRPLRAEVARTPGLTFASVLRLAPGKVLTDGIAAGDPLATGFPADAAALSRFDVVVLVGTRAADVASAEEAALLAFVEEGGGLFVVGDDDALGSGGWEGRALARVLPVVARSADEGMTTGTLRAERTAEGRAHPVLEGLDDALAADGVSVASLHRVGALRPGATTLLATRTGDGPPRPLLVAGSAARGRTLVWLTNTLHRMQATAPAAYGALLRQGLRWLASRAAEREGLSLATDRARYAKGDVARVTATVRGPDRTPRADASVEARRLALDGKDAGPVALRAVADAPGTFTADVAVDGDEPVRVRVTASLPGAPAAVREVLLRTTGEAREGEEPVADPARLAAIAAASGGAVVPPTALAELSARLAASAPQAPRTRERSLVYEGPWWLLAMVACLLAEWVLRRRSNLP